MSLNIIYPFIIVIIIVSQGCSYKSGILSVTKRNYLPSIHIFNQISGSQQTVVDHLPLSSPESGHYKGMTLHSFDTFVKKSCGTKVIVKGVVVQGVVVHVRVSNMLSQLWI